MALDAQWSAVARGYRFALVSAAAVGVAAVAACTLTGYPLAGLFICVGLGLGMWNSRRLWTDTQMLVDSSREAEVAEEDEPTAVRPLKQWRGPAASSTGKRLGLITLVAFLVALAYRPLGWTVFVGLLVFQLLLMALLAAPLRKVVRP
ncbi:MAG TPA: hypothetical protein VFJ17_03570 [Mycobacteriales bacterium]|nr:hypothetical protein [Mycobacteriales bacterium]